MSQLKSIFRKSGNEPAKYAELYVHNLADLLKSLDFESIGNVINLFQSARNNGNTIFLCGNGGSAATSSHFANDLGFGASQDGKIPMRALCLASNNAYITCLANDIGYENVFAWQLRSLMRSDDILVAISASGNSPNTIKAMEYAKLAGAVTVAFVGFDGGYMKQIADHFIHVVTHKGDYGPVEDVHMVLDHLISTFLAFTE
jgi:D-sedoheptulose 7-phosphate isomerase